jgi:hypothetical protein
MQTYIAQVETSTGTQSYQLAAANVQEAAHQIEARANTESDGSSLSVF